jgi:hypothetical protein
MEQREYIQIDVQNQFDSPFLVSYSFYFISLLVMQDKTQLNIIHYIKLSAAVSIMELADFDSQLFGAICCF